MASLMECLMELQKALQMGYQMADQMDSRMAFETGNLNWLKWVDRKAWLTEHLKGESTECPTEYQMERQTVHPKGMPKTLQRVHLTSLSANQCW